MAKPDWPEPTTYSGTKYYYISAYDIAQKICEMLAITLNIEALQKQGHHDVPGDWFTGPF